MVKCYFANAWGRFLDFFELFGFELRRRKPPKRPEYDYSNPKCKHCNKLLDIEELRYFDGLPLMMGYGGNRVARCLRCKESLCGQCMVGHGCFMFTCQDCV